jgi:hypothetical protein
MVKTFNIITLSIKTMHIYPQHNIIFFTQHNSRKYQLSVLYAVMLTLVILTDTMATVVMLTAVILTVVAPPNKLKRHFIKTDVFLEEMSLDSAATFARKNFLSNC